MAECTESWFLRLSAWHDGETASEEAKRVESHVTTCGACQRDLERLRQLTATLRRRSSDGQVPAPLRDAVAVRLHARAWRRWSLAVAASVACLAVLLLALARRSEARAMETRVREEIVTRHLAGFSRSEPCDVASADSKVVSDWLSEHAGYPVSVALPEDLELLGGRICHLCGATTAALMLRRAGTPLTVFVPAAGSEAAREAERLAGSSRTCARDEHGFSICACASPQPMLAVAEAEPAEVARAFFRLPEVVQ